ncbi:MAG: tetratricopeptide repeat protein [Verrucomicrobiae bacterium]|nr:tetratricopeptide repeat protein [Verrucomicrobiae bacterium]
MTPAQAQLLKWFRDHAAKMAASGDRKRALKVIHGALDFAKRQADVNKGEGRLLFSVLLDAGGMLLHAGKGGEAANCLRQALDLGDEEKVSLTLEELAETRQRLGSALDLVGDEEGAAEQYEASLALLDEREEPPWDSIAHLANNLGMIRRNQGRFEEAAALYRRAQEIFEALGESHATDLATICNNQGSLFWAWDQPELARDFHLTALKLRRDHLPDQDPDIGQSACNLAAVYHDLGDFEKAGRNYERALAILKRNLREDPDTYEIVASNYAAMLEESGQETRAARLRQQTGKRVTKARRVRENS